MAYSNGEQKEEMDWELLKKTLISMKKVNPVIILWGGEPLLYTRLQPLLELLDELDYTVDICTNGTHITEHLDLFTRMNNKIGFLVSMDGLETAHDAIRGQGAFGKTWRGLQALFDLNRTRHHWRRIQVGVEVTMVEKNIDHLPEFAAFLNSLPLAWVVFNMQWYLNAETGRTCEKYLTEHWFKKYSMARPRSWSWRGHECPVGSREREKLTTRLAALQNKNWDIPVVFQPPLAPAAVADFFARPGRPAVPRRYCRVHWSRLDFYPDGSAKACKQYPDISLGNLHENSLEEIWNGRGVLNFRNLIIQRLLPICAKCPALYTYGK